MKDQVNVLTIQHHQAKKSNALERVPTKHVAVVTRPLPRDGRMAKDHGVQKAWQLPMTWTRSRGETTNRQRASGAKTPDSAE